MALQRNPRLGPWVLVVEPNDESMLTRWLSKLIFGLDIDSHIDSVYSMVTFTNEAMGGEKIVDVRHLVNLEEEKRLMYVAMTRAMERLIITYRKSQKGQAITIPSRFLKELSVDRNSMEMKRNESK